MGNGQQGQQQGQQGNGGDQPERPDQPNVGQQLVFTDLRRVFQSGALPFFGSGDANLGKTNFDARKLNELRDLVDQAKPHELSHAGDDLWDAATAIRRAASELDGNIERVDWEGESGDAFRNWGKNLVKDTRHLATYSEDAATQIKAAGEGLSMVKGGMPERDTRVDQKAPHEIPAPKREKGNPEYDEAVKVEKNRQEAINQMNRLGSYYQVSHENMARSEPPTFKPMPDVGMPPPPPPRAPVDPGAQGSSGGEGSGTYAGTAPNGGGASQPPAAPDGGSNTPPADRVSTGLDSVAPPIAPADPSTHTPSPAQPNPSGGAQPNVPGVINPLAPQGGKTPSGTAGVPRTAGTQPRGPVGRAGGTGQMPGSTGRPGVTGPVGRPTGPGQSPGIAGRPSGTGQTPGITGRPTGPGQTPGATGRPSGVMGQSPGMAGRPTGPGTTPGQSPVRAAGPTNSPRTAGRVDGVVGGTPNRGTTQANSPRIPRGTVVGTEQKTPGRAPTSGFGPRSGVIGTDAGAPSNAARRPAAAGPGGVVGTPRSDNTGQQQRAGRAFTTGGAGLVRGTQPAGQDDERESAQRPDYLTEEEETWTRGRPRTVPPVIE